MSEEFVWPEDQHTLEAGWFVFTDEAKFKRFDTEFEARLFFANEPNAQFIGKRENFIATLREFFRSHED